MKAPTIYDVAERAGVSKSLVSLVLRGSDLVSDEKRDAVLTAVGELNYTPSKLAAGLAGSRTRSIGIIIDDFENLWFAPVLAGLRDALRDDRYSLSVADASLNSHLGLDPIEAFESLRVDGIVIAGEVAEEAVERMRTHAVVLGTRALNAPGLPRIASDEEAGGKLATAHLQELGHERIVCVSASGASAAERERGYRAAMRERGLNPMVLHAVHTDEVTARTTFTKMLNTTTADELPTAVFVVNDPMAVGVIGALRDAGIEVPNDVSVVGYDNSPLAAYDLTSLTSVSGDPRELGEIAGRALLDCIENGGEARASRLLAPQLVVRRSTAARRC